MTTSIASDPSQWFDGLRPDARWQLPDPAKTPDPKHEPIEAFMSRVLGISGGPAPVFGEDLED